MKKTKKLTALANFLPCGGRDRCLLCRAPWAYRAFFLPNRKSIAAGRVCAYFLCARCHSMAGRDEAVERVIEAQIIRMN